MPEFKKLDLSHARRVFVVGDIHGSFSKLMKSLTLVNFNPKEGDHLLSVGDLVDRGPENHRVLEFLNYDWFHAIQGNHEEMHFNPRYADSLAIPQNGGRWAFDLDKIEYMNIKFAFENLPVLMEVLLPNGKRIGLAHANYPAYSWIHAEDMARYNKPQIVWDRSYLYGILYDKKANKMLDPAEYNVADIDDIYYGHTPMKEALHVGNQHWIDTGGTFEDGYFTLIEVSA